MEDFVTEVSVLSENIVNAAVEVYMKICNELLPTPAKSHYVFNLRDLSKCMQGVLQADAAYMKAPQGMLRYNFQCKQDGPSFDKIHGVFYQTSAHLVKISLLEDYQYFKTISHIH